MNSQEGASLKVNVVFFSPFCFYAFVWERCRELHINAHILNRELPKYPSVRRAIRVPLFSGKLREEQDHNWLSDLVPYLGG